MVDTTEKIENSELVTNRDQLVVVDNIESLIKVIRGQQVIFDKDLAKLYGVETKYLNKQVKRNIERFPEDFMFQLTKEECLRCQIGTSKRDVVAQGIFLMFLQKMEFPCLVVCLRSSILSR